MCRLAAPAPAQLSRELGSELPAPVPDALVGHDHAPRGQDQLDVAEAQVEHVIQPDGVADDLRREPVPRIGTGRGFMPQPRPTPN